MFLGQKEYQHGVKAITRKMQRENPKAKLTRFIETSAAVQETLDPGINEVLMVSESGRCSKG
jgi:hypothetical protein